MKLLATVLAVSCAVFVSSTFAGHHPCEHYKKMCMGANASKASSHHCMKLENRCKMKMEKMKKMHDEQMSKQAPAAQPAQ